MAFEHLTACWSLLKVLGQYLIAIPKGPRDPKRTYGAYSILGVLSDVVWYMLCFMWSSRYQRSFKRAPTRVLQAGDQCG